MSLTSVLLYDKLHTNPFTLLLKILFFCLNLPIASHSMKEPKKIISIILPVYNVAQFLPETLNNLLTQSYRELEIITIDDRSTDASFKILSQFKKKYKRLRVYRNKKRYGLAVCLNRGLKRAKGTILSFANAKDTGTKERLQKQLRFLLENPKVVAVGTQCRFINSKDKRVGKTVFPLESEAIYQTLLHGASFQFESALINKQMLPKDLLKFTGNTYPFTYSEVFMKLFQYGQVVNLRQALYYHRKLEKTSYSKLTRTDTVVSFIKILLKSVAMYDYRPSLSSFLFPLVKQI